jgi:hypothetical protein
MIWFFAGMNAQLLYAAPSCLTTTDSPLDLCLRPEAVLEGSVESHPQRRVGSIAQDRGREALEQPTHPLLGHDAPERLHEPAIADLRGTSGNQLEGEHVARGELPTKASPEA